MQINEPLQAKFVEIEVKGSEKFRSSVTTTTRMEICIAKKLRIKEFLPTKKSMS